MVSREDRIQAPAVIQVKEELSKPRKRTEGKSLEKQTKKHKQKHDEQGTGTGLGIENEGNNGLYLMLTRS